MIIQYLSDLHLELLTTSQCTKLINHIERVGDILVLAGDIGNPFSSTYNQLLIHVNKLFDKIFLITGNHEYYNHGRSMEDTHARICDIVLLLDRVTFLDTEYEDYKGYRFIGTTLWTKITDPHHVISDTTAIRDMTVDLYNALHDEHVLYLETIIADSEAHMPIVVITHHIPLTCLTHERYRIPEYELYHQWFSVDLDLLIQPHKSIRLWIYGHTHAPSVQEVNGIIFACNPTGYKGENTPIYNKIINL